MPSEPALQSHIASPGSGRFLHPIKLAESESESESESSEQSPCFVRVRQENKHTVSGPIIQFSRSTARLTVLISMLKRPPPNPHLINLNVRLINLHLIKDAGSQHNRALRLCPCSYDFYLHWPIAPLAGGLSGLSCDQRSSWLPHQHLDRGRGRLFHRGNAAYSFSAKRSSSAEHCQLECSVWLRHHRHAAASQCYASKSPQRTHF